MEHYYSSPSSYYCPSACPLHDTSSYLSDSYIDPYTSYPTQSTPAPYYYPSYNDQTPSPIVFYNNSTTNIYGQPAFPIPSRNVQGSGNNTRIIPTTSSLNLTFESGLVAISKIFVLSCKFYLSFSCSSTCRSSSTSTNHFFQRSSRYTWSGFRKKSISWYTTPWTTFWTARRTWSAYSSNCCENELLYGILNEKFWILSRFGSRIVVVVLGQLQSRTININLLFRLFHTWIILLLFLLLILVNKFLFAC